MDPLLIDACGDTPSWLCELTWNATENRALARGIDWFVSRPLLAGVVLLVAMLINRYMRKAVTGLVVRITTRDELASAALERIGITPPESLLESDDRSRARAATLSAVLRACVSALVWSIATLTVLGIFNINLGPLLAGAGIAGIAVGLGAQSLVRDCIAGFFIILEDQYGVGDTVDLGAAIGSVETVTLRATTVRSVDGTQWTVPNGTIVRVGNRSRAWVRVALDVTVGLDADLLRAQQVVQTAVNDVCADPMHAPSIIVAPSVVPVERVTTDGVVLRVTLRTKPGSKAGLVAALRVAVRAELDAAGVPVMVLADA